MKPASDLIAAITEIAEDVYRELGSGHLESPYQKAMEVGLRHKGIKFEAQKVSEIKYQETYVGECNLDLLVDKRVIVELKAAGQPNGGPDQQQLEKYMRLFKIRTGMLINFTKLRRTKNAEPIPDKPEITIVSGKKSRQVLR